MSLSDQQLQYFTLPESTVPRCFKLHVTKIFVLKLPKILSIVFYRARHFGVKSSIFSLRYAVDERLQHVPEGFYHHVYSQHNYAKLGSVMG